MADVLVVGPLEQLTGWITSQLQTPFSTFPAHDENGAVIGVTVVSFMAATVQDQFPNMVCRLVPSAVLHSGIGGVSDVATQHMPDQMPPDPDVDWPIPPGTVTETIVDDAATLELRLGARNEVERERMMDWALRTLLYHAPVGVLDILGVLGVNVLGLAQAPVLPDIDPNAPRQQGMPPWPGQLFFRVQAEYSVSYDPLPATIDVENPDFTIGFYPGV